MSRDKFLKGALILTVAGILVKIIGSANRILLSRMLGGEGIGLYQMAYPIYLLALSISSAGIPVAISIIVSERLALKDYRGADRVFKISLSMMCVTGVLFALLLYFGASFLTATHIVRDPRAYYAIAALAPAVLFATIVSSYRGYFQGYQIMTPTAVSQIVEQFVRVAPMVTFAYMLLPRGIEYAAAGASFGAGPGAFCGLLVLLYFHYQHQKSNADHISAQTLQWEISAREIISKVVRLALPVSLANIMLPVVSSLDMLIVPQRLEVAGYSIEQATTLFGYLTGMGLPLVMMATIPTASIAASIVPAISEAYTLGDIKSVNNKISVGIRLCCMMTIPASVGMAVLATPISKMLYGTPYAGACIAVLAPSIFFLGLHQVTTGVLQGFGRTVLPVVNMVVSAAVKVWLAWVLTADLNYGIIGAALATVVDFAFAVFLNIFFLKRSRYLHFPMGEVLKISLSSTVMGATTYFTYNALLGMLKSNTIATLSGIIVGGLVYMVMLIATKAITMEELGKLPVIGKFFARYRK